MAKQAGVVQFQGKLGNVIGYYRKGKYCLRTKPEVVHQSAATKQSASVFGVISRKGKLIRRAIVPRLSVRYDGSLVNRLNRVLVKGQSLQDFQFNPYTRAEQLLTVPPIFTPEGVLQLPAQEFRRMGAATHLEVRIIGVRISFSERRVVAATDAAAVIQLDEAFNGLALPLSVPGKGELFVILQLKACTMHNNKLSPLGDRRYMAADVITIIPGKREKLKPEVRRSSFTKGEVLRGLKLRSGVISEEDRPFNHLQGANNTLAAAHLKRVADIPPGKHGLFNSYYGTEGHPQLE